MKFSFIIPVYNVAPYLRECLDSLLAQNISAGDYEIVAVNDDSTDGSLAILREYETMYPRRFVIIDQPNAGPGVARNTGFAASCGDFIWFVDGDDVVRRNSLQAIAETLKATDAEVLRVGYGEFAGAAPAPDTPATDGAFTAAPLSATKALCFFDSAPWDKVFSRELLLRSKLAFPPLRGPEDMAEMFRIVAQARNIAETDTVCYFYRQRHGSLMQLYNESKMLDTISALGILRDQIPLFPEVRLAYEYLFWKRLDWAIKNAEALIPHCDKTSKAAIARHLPTLKAMSSAVNLENIYICLTRFHMETTDRQLSAYKNSLSWKITAPLRFLAETAFQIQRRFV